MISSSPSAKLRSEHRVSCPSKSACYKKLRHTFRFLVSFFAIPLVPSLTAPCLTDRTAGSDDEHPFEMHKMMPYWSAAADLMKTQPVSFRQGGDGEISDVVIGTLNTKEHPHHAETERLQEGT